MQQILPTLPAARPRPGRTRWGYLLALLTLLLTGGRATAQVVKTLPGDYASFSAAINDINTNFATGGVTVNVAAGYVETAPAGGLPLLTAQGTAGTGQIIFQKAGTGANPLIQAGVGTLAPASLANPTDGIVRLSGADYVTFTGIDLSDANTSQTTAAEYGYGFFRASATNGCQNNTLQNCTVTLNRSGSVSNGLSYGVYMATTDVTGATITPTSAAGSNSANKFYTNTILNTQTGIYVNGYGGDTSPYALSDQGNDFGGTSASTGNSVRNFGGVSGTSSFGIRATYQQGPNASYNTVDNAGGGGAATASSLYGVYLVLGASGNITMSNNTVTLTQAPTATTTNQATAVYSSHTGTGTANLNNNVVTYTVAAGGGVASANSRFLVLTGNGTTAIGALNMNGNQVTCNLSSTAASSPISGAAYGVNCQGSVTGAASLSNNTVTYNVANSSTSAIAATCYGVAANGTSVTIGGNLTMSGNTATHALNLSSTGSTTGTLLSVINFLAVTGNLVANNNTENLTGSNSSTTFSSSLFGFTNQSTGTVAGTTTVTNNTANYGTSGTAFSVAGGTMSGTLFGCTNAAALTGAAVFNNNTANYYLTVGGTATLSSALTALTNSGAASSTLTMSGNAVNYGLAATTGTVSGALTGVSNGGAVTGAAAMSSNVLTYSGTRTTGTFSSAFTGVANTGATSSTLTLDGNTLLGSSTVSTGAMTIFAATATSTGLLTFSNNRYQNGTTGSTGQVYFINANGATANILTQGNQFTGFAKNGTSTLVVYGYYNFGTPGTGTHTITGNTITGINLLGGSGAFTSPFVGIFSSTSTSTTHVITNNVIGSLATGGGISTGASVLTGMYAAGYGANNSNIAGNTIQSLSGGSTVVGITNTSSNTTPISAASSLLGGTVAGNTVSNLSTSGAAGVYGMYLIEATTATAALVTSGNKISDLSANGAGASTAYGLYVAGGVTHTLQNNVVGNLAATASTSSPALVGLYLNAGTTVNAYYNTVYLTGTGGTNFGAMGLAFTGTPTTLTLRNNLVVNNATATGTGISAALGRVAAGAAGTVPANLSTANNNNLLYAASPGYLYAEGATTGTVVNGQTTLLGYRNFMYVAPGGLNSSTTREQRAVSQNVAFASTTGTDPNFLRPDATVPTPVESGAQPIAGLTTDYAGATRNATTPDIGAYEGTYTYQDLVAPGITYTPLTNTAVTTNRSFTNVAVVDVAPGSGVNGAAGTRPRVYYKLVGDANAYNDNTSGTPGWKYTEATNAASPFSFVIDYSLLPATPTVGTTIQYFVVAQDGAATPNVALNAGTFAAQPASVALTGAAFPIGGPLNSYQITTPLPTTISVGTGQTYTSLTNTGGLFEAINNGVLGGNTTATITSDLTGELGTVALGPLPDNGNNYTLTIRSDGTLRNITGSATNAAGMIRLVGASRVTFDGQQPGGSQNLLFSNTTASAPTFSLTGDASNNKLTWLLAESANTSATSGTIVVGSGTATGNNFNEFTVVDIRSTGNATTATYANGIYSAGLSSTVPNGPNYVYYSSLHNFSGSGVYLAGTNNNNWVVAGNSLFQEAARTTALTPVRIAGGNNHTVQQNNIYQTAGTVSGVFTGISLIGGGTGHTVSGNFIGGTSGGASGGTLTASSTFYGILLTVGATPTVVQGNVIRAIANTSTTNTTYGIYTTAGATTIGGTTAAQGNTVGSATASQSISTAYNVYGILLSSAVASTVGYNQVLNLQTGAAPATTGLSFNGIYVAGAAAHVVSNNAVSGVLNGGVPGTANSQTVGIIDFATAATTVRDNVVTNVGNTATTTGTSTIHLVIGIGLSGATAGTQVLRNRVSNVFASSTGTGTVADNVDALYLSASGATVANNQLSIPAVTSTAPFLAGIYEVSGGNAHYYNSVYLTGSSANTGTTTYGFYRNGTAAVTLRNNLLYNDRTGSGFNIAIGTASTTNWVGAPANPGTNTSDYNLFFTASAAQTGNYGGTVYSFAGWKSVTGGDASSMSETSATVPAASLFTNPSTGDLSLVAGNSAAWYANGTGVQVPAIGIDYTGAARPTTVAAGAPDIGSTQVTPGSIPPAMTATPAAPVLGGTQTFSLGGRTLAQLTYGSTLTPRPAGTSGRVQAALPSNVVGRYYSGTNPPAPFNAGARYANAYFDFQDAGADGSGYTYQPTLTYDPASLGTIPTEADQRISQRNADNSGYRTYATTVNPAPARTLVGPDQFTFLNVLAISDQAAPLPVQLVRFEAVRQGANAALSWTTASELDNQGFEVQVSPDGQQYQTLGFVAGAGNSSNLRHYSFVDKEAGKAGLRYYRLRQLDYSGAATYSPVRSLTFEAAGLLVQAAPNPFTSSLTLHLTLPVAAPAGTLELTDNLGRIVLRQEVTALPAGASDVTVPGVAALPTGLYLLRVALPAGTQVLKVAKE